jgi:hypothetical protein
MAAGLAGWQKIATEEGRVLMKLALAFGVGLGTVFLVVGLLSLLSLYYNRFGRGE